MPLAKAVSGKLLVGDCAGSDGEDVMLNGRSAGAGQLLSFGAGLTVNALVDGTVTVIVIVFGCGVSFPTGSTWYIVVANTVDRRVKKNSRFFIVWIFAFVFA